MKILARWLYRFKNYLLNKRSIDMMIKLFAINVVEGRFEFSRIPKVLKPKVKEQIVLMVGEDNMDLVEELTKEG